MICKKCGRKIHRSEGRYVEGVWARETYGDGYYITCSMGKLTLANMHSPWMRWEREQALAEVKQVERDTQ